MKWRESEIKWEMKLNIIYMKWNKIWNEMETEIKLNKFK
jgi:hypothetical protein